MAEGGGEIAAPNRLLWLNAFARQSGSMGCGTIAADLVSRRVARVDVLAALDVRRRGFATAAAGGEGGHQNGRPSHERGLSDLE